MKRKKLMQGSGIVRAIFTVVFSLVLIAAALLLILILFIHALNANTDIPTLGCVNGEWLTAFFDRWYPTALGIVFVVIPFSVIVLLNANRIRRCFVALGGSFIVTSFLSFGLGLSGEAIIKRMSGEWQDMVIRATAAFRDFTAVCSVILLGAGAVCLSIYACINLLKGGSHEEDI